MSGARAAVPLLISLALAGCAPFNDAGGRYLPNTALEKARQEHAAAAASFTNAIRRYCSVRYETNGGRQACQESRSNARWTKGSDPVMSHRTKSWVFMQHAPARPALRCVVKRLEVRRTVSVHGRPMPTRCGSKSSCR